jgi:hypothetical protein
MKIGRAHWAAVVLIASCAIGIRAQQTPSEAGRVSGVKVTFAEPLDAAPPVGGGMPSGAATGGSKGTGSAGSLGFQVIQDPGEQGAFAGVVDRRLVTVNVTWFDSGRFKTHADVENLLRELLRSTNTQTWTFQVWSWANGQPSVAANVEHAGAKEGRWILWCGPKLTWAYQDGNDKWWWGAWERGKTAVLPTPCAAT